MRLIYFILFLTLLTSCRKHFEQSTTNTSINEEQFFKTDGPVPDVVTKIMAKIRSQNRKSNFIDNLVRVNGFPRWSKSIVANRGSTGNESNTTNDGDNMVFIPFSIGEQTKAFLSCSINNDSTALMRLYNKNTLITALMAAQNNAEVRQQVMSKLSIVAQFDKQLFQRDSLVIPGAFSRVIKPGSVSFGSTLGGRTTTFDVIYVTTCYTTTTAPIGAWQLVGLNPGESNPIATTTTVCYTYPRFIYTLPENVQSTLTSGNGCDNCPPEMSGGTDFSFVLNFLQTELNLQPAHTIQLEKPENRPTLMQLYYLVVSDPGNIINKQNAVAHLDSLLAQTAYITLVNHHYNTTQSPLTLWWNDAAWLSDSANLNTIDTLFNRNEYFICKKSFKFKKYIEPTGGVGGWQVAGTKDIHFNVVDLVTRKAIRVGLPTIYFGLPVIRMNGDYYSTNRAAEIAKGAVEWAEGETYNRYLLLGGSVDVVGLSLYFRQKIHEYMTQYFGMATLQPGSNIIVTDYGDASYPWPIINCGL